MTGKRYLCEYKEGKQIGKAVTTYPDGRKTTDLWQDGYCLGRESDFAYTNGY